MTQRREISERTAELVDAEVKRILDNAFERARAILLEHRDALDRLAAALLERETLDREEILLVADGRPLPPMPTVPPAPVAGGPPVKEKPQAPTTAPGSILGSPPPEPAGA